MERVEPVSAGAGVERDPPRDLADGLWIGAAALAIRALVVIWARDRFPPADDGSFYHVVAQRIAHGAGYTWLWPDGAVTYAAHYPVGYPALIGAAYALFGASPAVAMGENALIGAFAAFAAQRIVARRGTRTQAVLAGVLVAAHPGLVFYTPALMTEGVAAALLVVAVWLAFRVGDARGWRWRLLALGVALGLLTLVRPQLLVMAPILGFFAVDPPRRGSQRTAPEPRYGARLLRGAAVTALAVACCLPWTLRNCARMDRCVLVSANGGWNLLIGSAPDGSGAWVPIEGANVPPECRTVFGEADKDRCFGRAGLLRIRRDLPGFLALVPRKLSVTFDYFGAPGHYLHTSNFRHFDESAKLRLGVIETAWERLILLLAIAQATLQGSKRRRLRLAAGAAAALFAVLRAGWLGYLGLVVTTALAGRELLKRPTAALAAALVLTTAATHAVFFGAGRYGFVCAALLCVAAAAGPNQVRPGSPARGS